MFDKLDIFRMAQGVVGHAAARQAAIATNIANADTPGYHRKTIAFREMVENGERTGGVTPGPVHLDRSPLAKVHDPDHPLADASGHYDGSNVDLLVEVADAREAQRSYEANLKMFEQVRKMSTSLMDLLRR